MRELEGETKMSSEAAYDEVSYDDNEFYNQLIVKLKDDQYPRGEFGKARDLNNFNAPKSTDIKGLKNKRAHSYITQYAIELLYRIDPSCSKKKIKKAIKWFLDNISEGYLMNGDAEVYRHTAEALTVFLSIEGITKNNRAIIRQMIENFLDIQNSDGGWGNLSSTDSTEEQSSSKPMSTIFVIRALTTREIDYILNKVYTQCTQTELKKKEQEIKKAIDRGISFLIKNEEVKQDLITTAALIRNNPSIFGSEDYQEFSKSLISKLHDQSIKKVWLNDEGKVDLFKSSAILSALFNIKKYILIDFDIYEFRKALKKSVLDSEKGINGLDSLALCFLIDMFSVDCVYKKSYVIRVWLRKILKVLSISSLILIVIKIFEIFKNE